MPTLPYQLCPVPAPLQGRSPWAPRVEAASHALSTLSALTPAPLQHLTHWTRISRLRPLSTAHHHLSSLILKYQMQSYLRAQEAFTGCRTEDGSSEGAKVVPFTLPEAGQCLHQPHGLTSVMQRSKKRKTNAFPNDAILNYLEPANGLVSEQHFSEFSPREGHSCD